MLVQYLIAFLAGLSAWCAQNPAWGCAHRRCPPSAFRPITKTQGQVSGWQAGSTQDQTPAEPGEGQPATLGACPQDEDKPEDEMAQKRASLLERQQRRVEDARRRKQWQEAEKEQQREEAAR